MDAQMLMLYVLILINQVVAYGALIYLAMGKDLPGEVKTERKNTAKKLEQPKKLTANEEIPEKDKYLDYINKFEVEA